MSIEYTWKIVNVKSVDKDKQKNVIVQASFQKTGKDESGNEYTFFGTIPLDPDKSQSKFVAFNKVSEEMVTEWVKEAIDSLFMQHIDECIANGLNESKYKTQNPWDK